MLVVSDDLQAGATKVKIIDKHVKKDYYEEVFGKLDNPYYTKVNPSYRHLYKNQVFCYVCSLVEQENSDQLKKHTTGPYSRAEAVFLMTMVLAKGHCCWIEESKIR